MEYNEKSKKLKKKIALILVFVLLITSFIFFVYYDHVNSIWNDYEAIDSFSGNCEHFDKIAEIVLKHSKETACDRYLLTDYGIYTFYEDYLESSQVEITLSENDMYSLNKVKEILISDPLVIYVKEYGIEISRDETTCDIVYLNKDIDDVINKQQKEELKTSRFKKIENNWYNVVPENWF